MSVKSAVLLVKGQVMEQRSGSNNRIAEGAFALLPKPDGFQDNFGTHVQHCNGPKEDLEVLFFLMIQPAKS